MKLWYAEARATLALAGPLILSNLVMALIQATDVLLLGWLGAPALAAAALGTSFAHFLSSFGFGLTMAASPMLASAIGRKARKAREVRRSFRQCVWAIVWFCVPCLVVLGNAGPIIRALGQEAGLAADAALFLRGYMWAIVPYLLFQIMRNFVSALERPGWIVWISSVGIIANALLSWSLIFGHFGLPALGIFGSGLASSLVWSTMAAALALVIRFHPRFRRYHLFAHWWRADWSRFRAVWRLGTPIALTLGFETGVFLIATYLMGLISMDAVAAHAIALQIVTLGFMVPMGLGQAVTVRVGLAYGRADPAGIARAGWTAYALCFASMGAIAVVMWTMPQALVALFLQPTPDNAGVARLAVSFLLIAAMFELFDGAQAVGAGMLRGLHDTKVPMFYASFGYWVVGLGGGVVLAFGMGIGGRGIWLGLALGLATVALLMLSRWMRRAPLGLVPATGAVGGPTV